MEIMVGDYRLGRFEESWCIRKKYVIGKGKGKGEIKWVDPQYFYQLDIALKNLLNRMLREDGSENDMKNVNVIMDKIHDAKMEILCAVEDLKEIKQALSE